MLRTDAFDLAEAKDILKRMEMLLELLKPYDGTKPKKKGTSAEKLARWKATDKAVEDCRGKIPYELCMSGMGEGLTVKTTYLEQAIPRLKGMIENFTKHKDDPDVIAYREAVERMDSLRKKLHDRHGYDAFTHMGACGLFGKLGWSIRYIH